MPFDTTTAPSVQEAPRAHPNLFDKQIWLKAIMRRKDIRASAKNLAWTLADHHNQGNGLCNASTTTLAEDTGTSRSVVNENLVVLRDAGIIDWTPGNSSRSNRYVLKGVEIHDRAAKPASPAPQRGKRPALRLVPKEDPPASETVRPGGHRLSVPADNSLSVQADTNTLFLTPKGSPTDYTEGGKREQKEEASVGPASPLCPLGGDGSSGAGEDGKQPETTWPDTLGWTRDVCEMAEDHYGGFSRSEIKELFSKFRDRAQSKNLTYSDWHGAWMRYFKGSIRIRNENRKLAKGAMWI